MTRWTADDVTLHVYTFKEGLLSTVAHDLKLQVMSMQVDVEGDQATATIDAASLRCLTAMKRGAERPRALSESQKREIEDNIRRHILHTDRFPEVRFTTTEIASRQVRGTLDLHGVSKPIALSWAPSGSRARAVVEIDQRDHGITPFTALMGTMKVKPTIRIELETPWPLTGE